MLEQMAHRPGFRKQDRMLGLTTISFDIAALEIFLPLVVGGELTLLSEAEARDGGRICDLLELGEITVAQATPATWRMVLAAGWQAKVSLTLLCGGEPLSEELASKLLERCEFVSEPVRSNGSDDLGDPSTPCDLTTVLPLGDQLETIGRTCLMTTCGRLRWGFRVNSTLEVSDFRAVITIGRSLNALGVHSESL